MNTMTNRRSQQGFTLIELMIVVAVMGILLAVAIPAYNEQVRSTRRADMKADVMQIVQALERFHTVNDTYNGFPTAVVNSPTGGTTAYTITPSNLTRTTYTVTAVPQNAQATDRCGTIAINQAGVVTISTGLDREICW